MTLNGIKSSAINNKNAMKFKLFPRVSIFGCNYSNKHPIDSFKRTLAVCTLSSKRCLFWRKSSTFTITWPLPCRVQIWQETILAPHVKALKVSSKERASTISLISFTCASVLALTLSQTEVLQASICLQRGRSGLDLGNSNLIISILTKQKTTATVSGILYLTYSFFYHLQWPFSPETGSHFPQLSLVLWKSYPRSCWGQSARQSDWQQEIPLVVEMEAAWSKPVSTTLAWTKKSLVRGSTFSRIKASTLCPATFLYF